jgi:RNA polymerase sigma factor (sigma-70 family)
MDAMKTLTQAQQDEMALERRAVLRYCVRYTGDPDTAEDLAQLTMFQAWRHTDELRDPEARLSWLLSIARNVCRMWGRKRSRELSRLASGSDDSDGADDEWSADEVDLEIELERDELAMLLDRAMALLPTDAREVLVRRYIDESPQAEVAAQLGISEGAVEARLHRGKIALRRVLTTDLSADAISYGLILPSDAGWQATRLWCPGCGTRVLDGVLDSSRGALVLRCPICSPFPAGNYIHSSLPSELSGVRTYKPALSRVLAFIDQMFRVDAAEGGLPCPGCGRWVPVRQGEELGIYLECRACDWLDHETWHSLTWSLPEARAFWKEHPRMRFMPEREIEFGGVPAIVTGFESVTGADRLEVVTLRDSLQVVRIEGARSRQHRE